MKIYAEEHDVASVDFLIKSQEKVICQQNKQFSVGYGDEMGVPKIIDDTILGMEINVPKCLDLSNAELNEKDKAMLLIKDDNNFNIMLNIIIKNIIKIKEFWNLSEFEKLHHANCLKNRGNALFKKALYTRALSTYKLGIRALEGSVSISPAQNDSIRPVNRQARDLLVTLLTNAALCLLQIYKVNHNTMTTSSNEIDLRSNLKPVNSLINPRGLMKPCLTVCQKAVNLNPNNSKAWFRMGQAYAITKEYAKAVEAGELALKCYFNESKETGLLNTLSIEVEKCVKLWRESAALQTRSMHTTVRQAFLRRAAAIRSGKILPQDEFDESDSSRLDMSPWSNNLADNMMSLHEELEAFGEKMPEKSTKLRSKTRVVKKNTNLPSIDDVNFEFSDDE